MKKLLIIQLDDAYFLYETLRVLEKSHASLKDFDLTVLANPNSLVTVQSKWMPLISKITTDIDTALKVTYDMSFNLSMNEASWNLHTEVMSQYKAGPYYFQGELKVPDLWSTFLLTVKSQPPFLTFHLQDIYKNILGIRKLPDTPSQTHSFRQIVLGNFNPSFFTKNELEAFVDALKNNFPGVNLQRIDQIDLISDLSHTLYLGPASFDGVRVCEAGARGIFIGSRFMGLNLLPYGSHHLFISTRGEGPKAEKVLSIVESSLKGSKPNSSHYSLYQFETENLYGVHLESLNPNDLNYPFYQSHAVLWNFLLNLFEINLNIAQCSNEQVELLQKNQHALSKLLRLHDYALRSIDIVYQEAKSEKANAEKIEGHLQHLAEMDELMAKISDTHPMLRPFLDFYRIRRSQNDGHTLLEQVQHSFLTYSEEHHALSALNELFSVTLKKNEVSIR